MNLIAPDRIKQTLRQRIQALLCLAKEQEPEACLIEVRERLLAIQSDCEAVGKVFIVVEEAITCDRHELGGCSADRAILFRGPKADASVAICVTAKGSLLHRNDSTWQIYRNAGDIHLKQSIESSCDLICV